MNDTADSIAPIAASQETDPSVDWETEDEAEEQFPISAPDLNWDEDEGQLAQGLAERAGLLRDRVGHLGEDVGQTHRQALGAALREAASAKSRRSAAELLAELSEDRGFSWAAVAELLNISVPALRKWRLSGGVSGPNRARLNQLCAFCDLLAQYAIDDVAAWLETPLIADYYVTPRWLYARYDEAPVALLEYASQLRIDPVCWLETLDPGILPNAARREHAVVVDADGTVTIQRV